NGSQAVANSTGYVAGHLAVAILTSGPPSTYLAGITAVVTAQAQVLRARVDVRRERKRARRAEQRRKRALVAAARSGATVVRLPDGSVVRLSNRRPAGTRAGPARGHSPTTP